MGRPRPKSFERDENWAEWVLEFGLPELPPRLEIDESVPISRWVGPTVAAVLEITRHIDDEGVDLVDDDTTLFVRRGREWEPSGAWGGSSDFVLHDDAYAAALGQGYRSLAPRQVIMEPHYWAGGTDWMATAVTGIAGREAAFGEVEQHGGHFRARLERSIGMFVIAIPQGAPAVVRVLDSQAKVLEEISVEAHLD